MSRGSLQARKHEVVREALRLAAEELIASRGYEKVTVADVARAAGVSRRTYFRYFETKEDVVVAGGDRFADGLLAAVAARPAREAPLRAIRNALVPVLEEALAKPALIRGVIEMMRGNTALRRAMLERRNRMEERLAVVLARRMGLDPRRDSAPVLLAYLTRAVSDTAFNVWYDQRREDVAGLVDELLTTLRSVAAPPRRRGGRRRGPPPAGR
ncbi:MAG TPA: TetR family transcriptional regulator [Vicinamibacteria bacterium]